MSSFGPFQTAGKWLEKVGFHFKVGKFVTVCPSSAPPSMTWPVGASAHATSDHFGIPLRQQFVVCSLLFVKQQYKVQFFQPKKIIK